MQIPVLAYVAAASFLLPPVFGLRCWKRLDQSMKFFLVFTLYAALHVLTEYILGRMRINNHFLLNLFDLISFEVIIFLYYRWLRQKRIKDFFQIVGLAYLAYWVLEMSYNEVPADFQTTISTAANLLLVISSVVILNTIVRLTDVPMYSLSISWIATGVILYSGGTIAVQTMSNVLLKMGKEYFDAMWTINWIFCVVTNSCYARSLWCKTF